MIYTDLEIRETLKAETIELGINKYLQGSGTTGNGFIIKNPKNHAFSALSGTSVNVELDLNGTAYYFSVYPTKA